MQAMLFAMVFVAQIGSQERMEVIDISHEVFKILSRGIVATLREMSLAKVEYGAPCSDLILRTDAKNKNFSKLVGIIRNEVARYYRALKTGQEKPVVHYYSRKQGFAIVGDNECGWRLALEKQAGRWKLHGIFISLPPPVQKQETAKVTSVAEETKQTEDSH